MNVKIGLIGYDFPHAKTNNFIVALQSLGYEIECVIAAPWRNLKIPDSYWRTTVKREIAIHPRQVAESYQIPYYSVPHNSKECIEIIKKHDLHLGIIGGARMLKNRVIKSFKKGVVNFHAALIPENRGLDTFKWAIYLDLPTVVTAHFIDYRVDGGRIIRIRPYPVYLDDTIYDLQQRGIDTEVLMIEEVMNLATKNPLDYFERVGKDVDDFRSVMPKEIALEAIKKFPNYKKKWAVDR